MKTESTENPSPATGGRTCPTCTTALVPHMTKQGVEIDYCPNCRGIWLDRGEIYHFTREPGKIQAALEAAIRTGHPSRRPSPLSGDFMQEITLLDGRLQLDYCPQSGGLWFDHGELKTLIQSGLGKVRLDTHPPAAAGVAAPVRKSPALMGLPNLALRSFTTLVSLYGLLGIVLIALIELGHMDSTVALALAIAVGLFQFVLAPFLMDLSLRWFYTMHWAGYGELPAEVGQFIQRVCTREHMKLPRIGIIEDGAPNAFTYGHTPNNARIVITRGLLDLLDKAEVNAVVAHELGHARHWDILLMTVASLVPLVLYYVYRTLSRIRAKKQAESVRLALMLGAYVLYIVAEYVVLWFSRTREYYADRFSGEATGNPSLLASALVKIGYGLAGKSTEESPGAHKDRRPGMDAIGAMGIFDVRAAHSLAIASAHAAPATAAATEVDRELLKKAARWDLWNPWAVYYEIQSTHPLIAKRLQYLSNQAEAMGREPYVVFDEQQPESYRDEFVSDLITMFLPFAGLIAGAAVYLASPGPVGIGLALGLFGAGYLDKTRKKYPFWGFPPFNIAGLLASVKVSAVRPVPCTLKGKVIGKGVPGLIWSEDFVVQDDTGIMFLDYRQPLAIWQWVFGLFRAGGYQGQEVTVEGWYRRAPVPYVEIKTITAAGKTRTCYAFHAQMALGALSLVASFVVFLGSML